MPWAMRFAVLAVIPAIIAQRPGNGISKQTYSATDPQGAFTWFARYLPIHCGDTVALCNSTDAKCGQKGRANLCPENSPSCTGTAFSSFMFHQVNTSSRPSGPTTVAEVEAIFDEKLKAAMATNTYDAFMDHSVAFWASDLERYLALFRRDGVPFLASIWKGNLGETYYSLIIHGPGTQVVVEMITTAKPTSVPAASFYNDPTIRYTTGVMTEMGASTAVDPTRLRPLAVSKAVSDMDVVIDFYQSVLAASLEFNATYADGTRVAFFNPGFASMSGKMQVRFVQRPANATSSSLSVKGLEQIKFAGHNIVHDNAKNNSANTICGFDKWYDNHYAIDGGYLTLTEAKANMDQHQWPYYQAWGGGQGPENLYIVDPTGDSVQLDSSWTDGAPPGVAGDALGTMCTQGNCVGRPTPATCSAKLKELCPGLVLGDTTCADCVYDSLHWKQLKAAACLNADVVVYCVGS